MGIEMFMEIVILTNFIKQLSFINYWKLEIFILNFHVTNTLYETSVCFNGKFYVKIVFGIFLCWVVLEKGDIFLENDLKKMIHFPQNVNVDYKTI